MRGWLGRAATGAVSTVVEALEELRIHRGRVLLSLIGVALAICALASVVAAGAIAEQSGREMQERSSGRPATVQFQPMTTSPPDPVAADAAWRRALDRHEVDFASRNGWAQLSAQFADGVVPLEVTAVDPDFGAMHRVQLEDGAWFADSDAERLAPALIVNQAFWDRLGRPPLTTHPTVEVIGRASLTAVVIGVTPSRGEWDTAPQSYILADAYLALMPSTPDPMLGPFMPSYEAWLPPEQADELTESLRQAFAAELGDGATVDAYRTDYASFEGDPYLPLKLVIAGVAVVILLLGALGLLTIALVTVRTRIREIGIRRTFGATAGRVFFSVMMETVVGTFVAGVVGVGISIALLRSPLPAMLLGSELDDMPGFPIEAAVIGIVAAVVVGALAGLLPALAAVRVRVIDAIMI
ncbi:ABC transporter permease [Agromyces sp. MMS24-JH15]|uniref:ABC transporter permease n=1 Tax=Agromyces sp. MMS24-JH15 TaxID=3243765 RepID=UPI0037483F1A